uniref:Uncharacterized protein n=1 Tax=Panagrolaimus superbus TaxID=310955 RepID=A0A914XYG4_9BILA
MNPLFLFLIIFIFGFVKSQKPPFLQSEFERALTAYGPGLAVFSPYSNVDLFYDNIPFIGKIPVLGKEGTASKTGISPFYPLHGNPSKPFPPLYLARPLPIHAPDPVEVVAVPLDEEALHGEPLWPKELTLPWEDKEKGDDDDGKETTEKGDKKDIKNPFENIDVEAPSKGTKNPFGEGFIENDSAEFESKEAVNWLSITDKKVIKPLNVDEIKSKIEATKEVEESAEYDDENNEALKSRSNRLSVIRKKLNNM